MYKKNKQYKHIFTSLFLLEHNKYCSTFMINIESSVIHSMKYSFACKQIPVCTDTPFQLHSKGNLFKISGVCFKITNSMTNLSLFSTQTQYFPDENAAFNIQLERNIHLRLQAFVSFFATPQGLKYPATHLSQLIPKVLCCNYHYNF